MKHHNGPNRHSTTDTQDEKASAPIVEIVQHPGKQRTGSFEVMVQDEVGRAVLRTARVDSNVRSANSLGRFLRSGQYVDYLFATDKRFYGLPRESRRLLDYFKGTCGYSNKIEDALLCIGEVLGYSKGARKNIYRALKPLLKVGLVLWVREEGGQEFLILNPWVYGRGDDKTINELQCQVGYDTLPIEVMCVLRNNKRPSELRRKKKVSLLEKSKRKTIPVHVAPKKLAA